jgi:threonine/homoserine/homoserine lactone efflux protein
VRKHIDTGARATKYAGGIGQAIGQTLVVAVAVGLSPIPIIGVVVMLSTPRGHTNGPAFLAGWIFGLVALGTIVLLTASGAGADGGGGNPGWVNAVKLGLGLVLIAMAAKQWKGRPGAGEEAGLPGWMDAVDHFSARRSAGLGTALAAINPKNLILVVAGVTTIAQYADSSSGQALALALFVAVGSIGTALPVLLYLTMRERSRLFLESLKDWMARNNAVIMGVICLLLGAKLIGDAISGFSA